MGLAYCNQKLLEHHPQNCCGHEPQQGPKIIHCHGADKVVRAENVQYKIWENQTNGHYDN
jgi:hypothetical protein